MPGIHVHQLRRVVDHECLSHEDTFATLKGPETLCISKGGAAAEHHEDVSDDVPGVQPPCSVPGSNSRGDGDHWQAVRHPPGFDVRDERVVDESIWAHGISPCGPADALEGGKEPPNADSGQTEGQEGLTDDKNKSAGPALARGRPAAVLGGGKEPPGDDSEQAARKEGLTQIVVPRTDANLPVYTGRFHPLMQEASGGLPEKASDEAEDAAKGPPQACGAISVQGGSAEKLATSLAFGADFLSLRGGGDQISEGPSRERGAGVWSSSSSAGQEQAPRAREEYVSVPVSTWNLAGAGKKKVKGIITTVFEGDIVAIQEYPKQSPGWHTMDHGRMNAVLYQDVMMY